VYSSLQKVDIVLTGEAGQVAVQTDHREPAEIAREMDLSVVLAIARGLNPIRGAGCDAVRFAFLHPPPEPMLEVCRAVGAEIEIPGEERMEEAVPRDDALLASLADRAMRAIGSRLLLEHPVPEDEQGIEALCAIWAARAAAVGSVEEDEVGYWTAVVELAAAVGEILCRRFDVRWGIDPQFYSVVPLVLVDTDRSAMTNLVNKVERYFAEGPSESPAQLFRILTDQAGRDSAGGPVMFNLRPAGWSVRHQALVLPPLFASGGAEDDELPLIALVRDMPNAVANLPPGKPDDEIEALRAEAEENLRSIEVQIVELEGPFRILVVHGSYYASEKLLDADFVEAMSEHLSTDLLMAAVPVKGELWLTSAVATEEAIGTFAGVVTRRYAETPANQRLSTKLFLLSEGRPVGVAHLAGEGPGAGDTGPPETNGAPDDGRGSWAKVLGNGTE
jgi:hypothetical protein